MRKASASPFETASGVPMDHGRMAKFGKAKTLALIVCLVVLAASACDAFSDQEAAKLFPQSSLPAAAAPSSPTYQVRRGSITGELSLRGRVVAVQEAPLSFKTDGWVRAIKVSLGDQVEEGTTIAEMESPSLVAEVENARYRLDVARLNLDYNRNRAASNRVALAQAGLDQATIALERARLSQAKLMAPPLPEEVEASRLAIERAKNALWANQTERDGVRGNPRAPDYQGAAADARVAVAEGSVKAALLDYELKMKGPKAEDIALAQNAVVIAEANVAAAQASLEYEQAIRDLNEASRQFDVTTLEKEVIYREQLLQTARKRLDETRLVAPFSGTIVSLDAKVGDGVKPFSPVGILAEPSKLQVETNIPTEHAENIALGMPAKMALDGVQSKNFSGKVTSVADKPTTWQGKSVYRATIAFDHGTEAAASMRIGSDITLTGKTKDNVLVVPKDAVSQEGERRYVQLVIGGKDRKVEVKVGASSADWIEIAGGLDEGDVISVPGLASGPKPAR